MARKMRILGAAALGFALCGCASTGTVPKTAVVDRTCLTDTGSRVPPGKDGCRGIGRSWTGEDIDRTGKTNAADALSQLDPSVTVHH